MTNECEVTTRTYHGPLPPLPDLLLPQLGRYRAEEGCRQAANDLFIKRIRVSGKSHGNQYEWDQVADEKRKLKNLFIDANKVVKENRAHISRFYEIMKEQRIQKMHVERQIADTKEDIREYMEIKNTMEKYVEQYSVFEQFLERVVGEARTGELFSIRDVLNRYETLETTRAELARILKAEMETEAELRKEMVEVMESMSSDLKTMANRLVMVQVALKHAQDHRTHWEMMVQRVKNMILHKEEEEVVLKGACYSLYTKICKRRGIMPTAPAHDMEAQLNFIQKSIVFYKEVLTMATSMNPGKPKADKRAKKKKKRAWR